MMPMVPPGGQSPTLTLEQARSALKECSDLMDQPDVVAQITAAKAAAGPDPMMAMMLMMPVAVTAITPVLLKYGYQASQMGMMQLALAGSPYKEDEEINALSRQMREKMVPAEMLPVINAMMGVQMPNIQIQIPPLQMPFGLPGIPMPGFPGQPQQPPPPPPPEAPAPSADAPASS